MKKRINFYFFVKIFTYLKYLPFIILKIKNWRVFLLSYLGLKEGGGVFEFRNGIKIKTKDAISSATIAVIFIKKDYGKIVDNSVVIDIGANIGVFSLYAGHGKNTVVYAFEPLPENYDLLLENIAINKLEKNIIPFNLAAGAKKEKRKLYLGESPFPSFLPISDSPFNASYGESQKEKEQRYIEIESLPFKEVFDNLPGGGKIEKCDILKMDCEGAEFEILYNLPDEYFEKIKEIRMEYHNHLSDKKNNVENLIKFLEQKGFKVKKFKKASDHQGDLWLTQYIIDVD